MQEWDRAEFKSKQSKIPGFDPKTQKMKLYRIFSEIPQKRDTTQRWVKRRSKERYTGKIRIYTGPYRPYRYAGRNVRILGHGGYNPTQLRKISSTKFRKKQGSKIMSICYAMLCYAMIRKICMIIKLERIPIKGKDGGKALASYPRAPK